MKLSDYLEKKKERDLERFSPREYCPQCLFTKKTCYCSKLRPFDPHIKFVILIHQIEIERKSIKESYLQSQVDGFQDIITHTLYRLKYIQD